MKHRILCGSLVIITCSLLISLHAGAGEISPEKLAGTYICPVPWDEHRGITISLNLDHTFKIEREDISKEGRLENGVLVLIDDKTVSTPAGETKTVPDRLYPVQWGKRTYLVPEQEAARFIGAINSGVEPSERLDRGYYLKSGDGDKKVFGDPDLPDTYKKLLLPKAVEGHVIELTEAKKAWINLGSDSGIVPGMWLSGRMSPGLRYQSSYHGARRGSFAVQVSTVEKNRCLVESGFLYMGCPISSRRWD